MMDERFKLTITGAIDAYISQNGKLRFKVLGFGADIIDVMLGPVERRPLLAKGRNAKPIDALAEQIGVATSLVNALVYGWYGAPQVFPEPENDWYQFGMQLRTKYNIGK